MTWQDRCTQPIKRFAVLATVKTAARRLRRWPAASLDRRSARRCRIVQAGTEKRRFSRTEKHYVVRSTGWPRLMVTYCHHEVFPHSGRDT